MIGVNELQVHPVQITITKSLAKAYPKLRMYKSQLSGKILCSGSLGDHTNIKVAGIGEIIQSLIAGHLDHINLKDILKQSNSRNILKKPCDFLIPNPTSKSLSKDEEVVHAQVHKDNNSNDEKLNKKLIKKVMTIKDITDLETTPEGILVEDLGSDHDADMYRRDKKVTWVLKIFVLNIVILYSNLS